jgi:hypothetical protein
MKVTDSNHVELRVRREVRPEVLRAPRYRMREELSLILEAREYVKNRLPVNDRAMATAILLARDAVSDAEEVIRTRPRQER